MLNKKLEDKKIKIWEKEKLKKELLKQQIDKISNLNNILFNINFNSYHNELAWTLQIELIGIII
jgi:hypothetical protein